MRPVPHASGGRAVAAVLQRACRNEDLARWADGRYRVASDPVPDPDSDADDADRDDQLTSDCLLHMADTLTITDNRTGKQYEIPITDGAIRATDLRQIKTGAGRSGAEHLRPGVHEHGGVPQPHHLHRRRQGHPRVPRLSDRAAGRALDLSRNGVSDHLRRAADRRAAQGVDDADHAPHDAAREHQEADGGVPVRRAPDGRLPQHRRRVLDVLPRRQEDLRRAVAQEADSPADRQGPDASPPTPTATASAAPTSTPTTT